MRSRWQCNNSPLPPPPPLKLKGFDSLSLYTLYQGPLLLFLLLFLLTLFSTTVSNWTRRTCVGVALWKKNPLPMRKRAARNGGTFPFSQNNFLPQREREIHMAILFCAEAPLCRSVGRRRSLFVVNRKRERERPCTLVQYSRLLYVYALLLFLRLHTWLHTMPCCVFSPLLCSFSAVDPYQQQRSILFCSVLCCSVLCCAVKRERKMRIKATESETVLSREKSRSTRNVCCCCCWIFHRTKSADPESHMQQQQPVCFVLSFFLSSIQQ